MKPDTIKLVLVAGILFFIGSRIAGTTGPLSVLLCLLIYIGILIRQIKTVSKAGVSSLVGRGSSVGLTGVAAYMGYAAPMWVLIVILLSIDFLHRTGYAANPISLMFAAYGPDFLLMRSINKRNAAGVMRQNSDTGTEGQAVTHGREAHDYTAAQRPVTAPAPAAPRQHQPVDYSDAKRPEEG